MEHLARLGHRRVALLGAPAAVYDRGTGFAHRTRAGLAAAADRHGVDGGRPALRGGAGVDPQELADLLDRHPDLSGLVVQNEAAVGPVLAACPPSAGGCRRTCRWWRSAPTSSPSRPAPALTSVPVPAEEIGRQAVALLMRKLHGEPVPEVTLLPPRLTVRDSTAAPTVPARR